MSDRFGILSSAYYLPPSQKTVADIFRDEEIPTEPLDANVDFQADIGIDRVHVAGDEAPLDLGLHAAREALQRAEVGPEEIDLIIDFTSIPEEHPAPTWAAAGALQEALGAHRALATAVNTGGCASYHVALKTACALMAGNPSRNTALLFAGDKTPERNKTYYPITVTCDGGSAIVLRKGHDRQIILAVEVATVGDLHDVWYIPGLGRLPPGQRPDPTVLHMKSDMKRFNEGVIKINLFMFRRVMKAALKRAGLKSKDISYYIYPTFSTWDQRSFCRGFGIADEKIYTAGLRRHGHLQENDMILNYQDAASEGHIREGDHVMVTTNGAGFTWAAAIIRY